MTVKTYGIAGQVAPAATTNTDLLVIAASTQFVASSIVVCNRAAIGNDSSRYRIAIVKSGETLAAKHYIRYDKVLEPTSDDILVLGATLGAGDKIIVYANSANLSFSVFGAAIS